MRTMIHSEDTIFHPLSSFTEGMRPAMKVEHLFVFFSLLDVTFQSFQQND